MRLPLAAALLTLCLGCARDNDLSGSLSELFSLQFSRVEVYRNSEALQVSYFNNRNNDVDLVVRLTVGVSDLSVTDGQAIDLSGEYQPGHQRTSVIHLASGEPARSLPPVSAGDLVITSGASGSTLLKGHFSMAFEQTGEYGGGRTLVGNFTSTEVKDAAFDACETPPCPPPMP